MKQDSRSAELVGFHVFSVLRFFLYEPKMKVERRKPEPQILKELSTPTKPSDGEDQFNLGRRYAVGEDIPQDDAEAIKWYRKAAEQGYPAAQNDLGWMYQNGKGVPQNDVEAVRWYQKAAQQGYAIAQDNLGWMYQHGRGVPQGR